MLRRAVAITCIALGLTAACAFAFSPRVARMGRTLGRGIIGIERGFTPVPANERPHAADSAAYLTEGGVPGTYCPIPSRSGSKPQGTVDPRTVSESRQMSSVAEPADGKNDLLLPAPQAKCIVPTAATEPARPILP